MIEKIAIRNYKSLEDVELELGPLTVFVGPNNAGKSNILDCLWLLSELLTDGPGALHGRGGFKSVVWNGETKRTISLTIKGYLGSDPVVPPSIGYEYLLELVGSETHFNVLSESLIARFCAPRARSSEPHPAVEAAIRAAGPNGRKLLEFPSDDGRSASVWHADGKEATRRGGRPQEPHLRYLLNDRESWIPQAIAREVASWRFYSLVPSRMRSPVQARKELGMKREGENSSAVLHSIHSEHTDEFRDIESLLKTAVPEVKQLLTALTEQGQTYANIQEEHLSARIPSMSMSDGTLRLLAHLATLYSPARPPLVCFEEPENYIHPHSLELLANVLKTASVRTQLLITTHSPYLLNSFDVEDLVIVEKVEGKTGLKRAENVKGVKEALRKLGLGEMWYAGSLGGVPE